MYNCTIVPQLDLLTVNNVYRFNSSDYQGTRWRRVHFYEKADEFVSRKTPDREIAEELASKYPVGKMVSCYVNPLAPEEGVLEHQTKAAIYTLWWPMIFAIGGAGMIWSAWRGLSRRRPA